MADEVQTEHPLYSARIEQWVTMTETHAGTGPVKNAGTRYLPHTKSQVIDGAEQSVTSVGGRDYASYKLRAKFEKLVSEAIDTLVGVMHAEPAAYELPPELEGLREEATSDGQSLAALHRTINAEQLLKGRIGLLSDFPEFPDPDSLPHFVVYAAEQIINWDEETPIEARGKDQLQFVVLQEDVVVRAGVGDRVYTWEIVTRFRVIFLDEFNTYTTFVQEDGFDSPEVQPRHRVGGTLQFLPFVFVGAANLKPSPNDIPLLQLAEDSVALYRRSADYEESLHLQSQDTLVVTGDVLDRTGELKEDATPLRVGAGSVIYMAEGGKAEFIGVSGEGLGEQRSAYENSLNLALQRGPRLLEGRKGQAESGDALSTRVGASTASLHQIALTGAAGLERALKQQARWVGADPDLVSVTPNTDFTNETTEPRLALDLIMAIKEGLPLSQESAHAYAKKHDFTQMEFAEELAKWQQEKDARAKEAMDIAMSTANIERSAQSGPDDDEE